MFQACETLCFRARDAVCISFRFNSTPHLPITICNLLLFLSATNPKFALTGPPIHVEDRIFEMDPPPSLSATAVPERQAAANFDCHLESAFLNGIHVRYAEANKGKSDGKALVLFLHGWPESWYSWRHQLKALGKAGFHAVAPDMRFVATQFAVSFASGAVASAVNAILLRVAF